MKADELKKVAPGLVVLDAPAERELYSHDIGDLPPLLAERLFRTRPDFIVQPKNTGEIQAVLAFADAHRLPVIPRGAASWGLGGIVPARGGIVLDLSPLRGIPAVDTAAKMVTVQAGARWSDVEQAARQAGLALMSYPSSKFSTVGGWLATGGYGINNYKYGHAAAQVVSLTVVTPDGQVRRLSPADSDFSYFIGTEGTTGVIAEVTLRLRDIPQGSYLRLLYFSDNREAFAFLGRYTKEASAAQAGPNFIRFLDEDLLHDLNEVARREVFATRPAVLLEFGRPADEDYLTKFLAQEQGITEAPAYAASYLWNERLFAMKTKRLGPTLLASENILPLARAADFIACAKRIGRRFGVAVAIDAFVLGEARVLVMCTFLCDSRRRKYYLNLPLVALLTNVAVSFGATPYGLGLWNAGFARQLYSPARMRELKAFKSRVDPRGLLNPGKGITPGRGPAALFFQPAVFRPAVGLLRFLSPVLGPAARLVFGKDKKLGRLDYELSLHACARCGNCTAVCPAYLVSHDEALTARGKIALAKKLLAGREEVTRAEAAGAFLCLHCRACEEVCATNLELMALWDALEERLRGQFGWPQDEVAAFMKKVDASQTYWDMVEQKG